MLNELTLNVQGEQTMSSLEIAELTGKDHNDIIKECDRLNECYFKLATSMKSVDTSKDVEYERYKRKQYKYLKDSILEKLDNYFDTSNKYPKIIRRPTTSSNQQYVYYLTKIQTFDLLTGYPAELRVNVIRRWEELEEEKINREQGRKVSEPTEAEKEALKVRLKEAKARLREAKKSTIDMISDPILKEKLMIKFFP